MKSPASRHASDTRRSPRKQSRAGAPEQPLTAKPIQLLRASFARIEPQAGIAALIFYRNLFTLDPSLRGLFHTNIEVQGRKLMEALSHTVATLENPKALAPALEAMGRRHVTYGVRDEHCDTVNRALLQTLEAVLAAELVPAVRQSWIAALAFVADTLKRGAAPLAALKQG